MFRGAQWRQSQVWGRDQTKTLSIKVGDGFFLSIFLVRSREKKKAPRRHATSTSLRSRGDENAKSFRDDDDDDGDVVFGGVKILSSLLFFDGGFDDAFPNAQIFS